MTTLEGSNAGSQTSETEAEHRARVVIWAKLIEDARATVKNNLFIADIGVYAWLDLLLKGIRCQVGILLRQVLLSNGSLALISQPPLKSS